MGLRLGFGIAAGVIAGSAGLAWAQDAGTIVLEGIVIEGEKIPREYVGTFSSVGVVTEEQIEIYKVDDLRDSFNLLANVRWFEGNRANNGFVIRGINSEGVTQPTNNAPVTSVIIDGATQSIEATRRGARGTWDVKQIEVFRGPQSTLQGRNALAGAVIIETNDPSYEWEIGAEGTLGQDERKDGAFVLSGPLIENQLAFRISGEFRDQVKDIAYNVPANESLAEDQYRNLRGKILIEPQILPGLSVLLTASHTFDKPGVNAVNGADFFDREFSTAPTTAIEQREAENDNYIADATYQIGDGLVLRSISSKIESQTDISTPAGFSFQRDETRGGDDFTQDIRLEIGQSKDAFSGVIGAFYGDFNLPRTSLVTSTFFPIPIQELTSNDSTESKALYADLRYRILPDLSLLGGARLATETVRNFTEGAFLGAPIDVDETAEFEEVLPKAGVAYDIDENRTVALTAQEGYRSGFTEVVGGVVNTVDPESLWSYELAYRAQSPDKRWTFGATAFYYDYSNQQIPVLIGEFGETITINAGSSTSYGAEFEGRYDFGNGFTLFGAVGLLQTEFEDLLTNEGDFSGNEFPEAPQLTASFGGTYKHSSGFFVSADVAFTSDYFSSGSISNDPQLRIDSYAVANARLGYEDEKMRAMLYVDNLFDEQYLTSLSNNNSFGAQPVEATIGDGRTIGAQVSFKFAEDAPLEPEALK